MQKLMGEDSLLRSRRKTAVIRYQPVGMDHIVIKHPKAPQSLRASICPVKGFLLHTLIGVFLHYDGEIIQHSCSLIIHLVSPVYLDGAVVDGLQYIRHDPVLVRTPH